MLGVIEGDDAVAFTETGGIVDGMPVSIGQGEETGPKEPISRNALLKAQFHAVVTRRDNVTKLVKKTVGVICNARLGIEEPVNGGILENKRIRIHQRGQFVRGAPDVRRFEEHVSDYLALDAEIVLVGVRRAQIVVDKVDPTVAYRQEPCRTEIDIRCGRFRGEGVRRTNGPKRIC